MIAAVQMPALLILTCDQVPLAAGDSRRFFLFTLIRALLVTGGIAAGLAWGGLFWALAGWGWPIWRLPRTCLAVAAHGAWDPLHDGAFAAIGAVIFCFAVWYNAAAVAEMAAIQAG